MNTKHYYIGSMRMSAKVNDTDSYYYHPDHIGSSQFITDGSGDVYEHMEFTPYGEMWVDGQPLENNPNTKDVTAYRFTGKEFDVETGYYYFSARYLDPRTSRFVSVDPLVDNFVQPNGERNLYGYAMANPLRYTDPLGLNCEETDQAGEPKKEEEQKKVVQTGINDAGLVTQDEAMKALDKALAGQTGDYEGAVYSYEEETEEGEKVTKWGYAIKKAGDTTFGYRKDEKTGALNLYTSSEEASKTDTRTRTVSSKEQKGYIVYSTAKEIYEVMTGAVNYQQFATEFNLDFKIISPSGYGQIIFSPPKPLDILIPEMKKSLPSNETLGQVYKILGYGEAERNRGVAEGRRQ